MHRGHKQGTRSTRAIRALLGHECGHPPGDAFGLLRLRGINILAVCVYPDEVATGAAAPAGA